MFEFLFNHSPAVYARGDFVLLSRWPVWVLGLLIVAVAAGLGWWTWRLRGGMAGRMKGWRPAVIWLSQVAMAAVVLTLLWQPALRISTLRPQQNVVAVVVDDSRSMAIRESGETRAEQAAEALDSGLLDQLSEKFQVRLYRMGGQLERINALDELTAANQATRIGDSLEQVAVEAGTLPIGAVVLLSDGADNSGGISLETIGEIRSRRIPIHTVGFGRERFDRDIEIVDVQTPARALADSRLLARVALRQQGYEGQSARISLRDGGRVLASQTVTLEGGGEQQVEMMLFNAGVAGAKNIEVSIEPLDGEENPNNNRVSRLVNVESKKPRVLYFEGEPRWEYKFIRRAAGYDRNVELDSIVRTTQNKLLQQGPKLEEGFPSRVEQLFAYDGLIIGTVEASYFDSTQQELIRQFVDRRGGGILFLGGRASLSDGGYRSSALADLMPVTLPAREETFHRERAMVRVTAAGADSLITRLEEDEQANVQRWSELPEIADYQEVGDVKPGAVVLAEALLPTARSTPLLVTQNYGYGRAAVFATGGSWRWQMQQPIEDKSHEMFWQQMLRWLVTGTPGRVLASTPKQMLADESRVELTAVVRDNSYAPMLDARVEARILGPGGTGGTIELSPDPVNRGQYTGEYQAEQPGSFMTEVIATRGEEEIGRDVLTFHRQDGVAENFRAEQNRELLERLSSETGGQYYTPADLGRLADEISYSEAGITVREVKDLWNMPAILLLLLAIKTVEWILRRKWGVV